MPQTENNNLDRVSRAQERQILEIKGANGRKRGAPPCDQAARFAAGKMMSFWGDADVSASPHWVSTHLTVRIHALAMLGIGHLAWLKELDSKLIEAYTKTYQQDSAIRALNNKELLCKGLPAKMVSKSIGP